MSNVPMDKIKLRIADEIKKWVLSLPNKVIFYNANILYSPDFGKLNPISAFKYRARNKEIIVIMEGRLYGNRPVSYTHLQGLELEQAREEACYRIFGCKPGAYGAGVNDLIDAQNWHDEQDLGQVYVVWGGYAYGKKQYGKVVPEIFKHRLSQLDVAVKNVDNREYDMMDSDDFYSYHGGMIAAVRAFKGENPQAYIGDSSDPGRIKTRSTAEEAKHV